MGKPGLKIYIYVVVMDNCVKVAHGEGVSSRRQEASQGQ